MRSFLVRDHERYNQVARFDLETGELGALEPSKVGEEKPVGFSKRFSVGGTITVFRANDVWFIQIDLHRWMLGDVDLHLKRRGTLLLSKFTVHNKDFRRSFFDFIPGAFLQRMTDPTYDAIDAMSDDFPSWVIDLHEKQIGLRPIMV